MNQKNKHKEIEVRFLEINKDHLIEKLKALGAENLGEEVFVESIFSDKELTFSSLGKVVRLRKTSKGQKLSYKHHFNDKSSEAVEIEFEVSNAENATAFLEQVGLVNVRTQEKRCHNFLLDGVVVGIDEWPKLPPYVELEGDSEKNLKEVAKKLELDWDKVVFENAKNVIEKFYNIPVSKLKYFTFNKVG